MACGFILLNLFPVPTLAAGQQLGAEVGVYSFNGSGGAPSLPYAGLIRDSAGHLYGTTESGGTYNQGRVFELAPNANRNRTERVMISTATLPSGTVGTAYSTTLTASGGTTPYWWTVASGSLPAGLSLSKNGTISGTPTSTDLASFKMQVTDSSSPARSATKRFSISTSSTSAAGSTLTITSDSLPNDIVGTAYSSTLTATGGTTPYTLTVASGSLPAGLSMSKNGTISGTPTSAGQSNFTVQATDSSSPVQEATKAFSVSTSSTGSTLTVTAALLPNGLVGTAYSSTLTASGGTTPYSWTLASGALPAGLSMNSSGAITGTPTSSGQSSFTAKVTDSSSQPQTATKPLTITASGTSSTLAITGSISPNAINDNPYSSTDEASGGTPAYTWSISSGALPPGLNLAATTGTISGTPNQDETYNFTLQVVDSGSPQQSATQPGKITVITSTNTAWSLQTTSVGWQFVAPDGAVSCKINLLSKVDDTDIGSAGTECGPSRNLSCETQMETKYGATGGNWTNWARQMSARMTSLGFTGGGYYSFRYASGWSSGDLPYESSNDFGYDAIRDSGGTGLGGPFHVKDAGWIPNKAGMHCAPSFTPTNPDPYDPEFSTAFATMYADQISSSGFLPANTIIFQADDGDNLGLMNSCCNTNNGHPDGGYIIAANSPVQSKSSSTAGGTYTFTNKTYFVKEAMRDWLLEEYLCTGNQTPSGGFCTGVGVGTGSADPSSSSYVGASNASNALSAFNTAWSTSYTTWNTSDSGGLAGIQSGTYSSYGTGSGFLDENGTHLVSGSLSCSGTSGNGIQQNQDWGAVTQIQTDIDHFLAYGFAVQWATSVYNAYAAACGSACAPLSIPSYDGPNSPSSSSVYAGIGSFLADKSIGSVFWVAPPDYNSLSALETEVQSIINNANNLPVIVGNYYQANPNSFVAGSNPGDCGTFECQSTQAIRGTNWAATNNGVLRDKNPAGKYAVVGFEHWSMFDSWSQNGNFGLFTDNDNPYDGSAASTATSSGSWTATHFYTQPTIIEDSNGNYQGLAVASCTSGGSSPTWNTNFNGLTTNDGSCTWFNEGPYPPNPESANWGNTLSPIANFNTAGICDP